MTEELIVRNQEIARPIDEVFDFFSDPKNLESITPPWLHFKILTPAPLPRGEGAVYEYTLRVHGIPIRWRTLIETSIPNERFIDRQLMGPYALWHHTHVFETLPSGGTRIIDRVRYRIGWGIFGKIANMILVARDLEEIFDYRRDVIEEHFSHEPTRL